MSCPGNPAAPSGYEVYKGKVLPELSAWASQLIGHVSKFPYGTTWTMVDSTGRTIVARKDYHTWHYQPDGTLLTNICWPGITLYAPLPVNASPGDPPPVLNIETTTPDPTLAVYDAPPRKTDWPIVAACGALLGGTVFLFLQTLKTTAKAAR